MFAQQMAGNAPYPDPDASRALPSRPRPSSVLFDSRAMPSQPPLGMFDPHDGGGGGGSEGGGGSRSSAPNPFEDLTRLPFKSQAESGQSSSSTLASATVMLSCPTMSGLLPWTQKTLHRLLPADSFSQSWHAFSNLHQDPTAYRSNNRMHQTHLMLGH